jgi:hypothetical protein
MIWQQRCMKHAAARAGILKSRLSSTWPHVDRSNTPASLNTAADKQNYCTCSFSSSDMLISSLSLFLLIVSLEIMLIYILMSFFTLQRRTWETGTHISMNNMATLFLCKYHSMKAIVVLDVQILP